MVSPRNCKVIPLKRYPKRKKGKPATTKRHTQSTIVGMDNLTAILLDLHFLLRRLDVFADAIQTEVRTAQERIDLAMDTANIIRVGPYAYPKDGMYRPKRKKVE